MYRTKVSYELWQWASWYSDNAVDGRCLFWISPSTMAVLSVLWCSSVHPRRCQDSILTLSLPLSSKSFPIHHSPVIFPLYSLTYLTYHEVDRKIELLSYAQRQKLGVTPYQFGFQSLFSQYCHGPSVGWISEVWFPSCLDWLCCQPIFLSDRYHMFFP